MGAFNYNIGIMSKFAYENFWKNVDKSLSISEKRKLYEQFYKENEAAINESVNELLEKTKTASFLTEGRVVNEGLFDRVKSKEETDEDSIPDDDTDYSKIRSMSDLEAEQVRKRNKQEEIKAKEKKLKDELNDWMSHQEITLTNVKGDAYVDQNLHDINFASDLVYHLITNPKDSPWGDAVTTQDVELPYSFFNVTDVRDFTAVFAFKDLPNVDLSNWNVSNGTCFEGMFYKSTFNNDSIKDWELKKAQNIKNMFIGSDFDKKDVLRRWALTINQELGYLPVIGRTSADDTESVKKRMGAWIGSADDIKRKTSDIKKYRMQAIMDTTNEKKYVLDTMEFINEQYGMNEGVIRDFAQRSFSKIKDAFETVGVKLKDGFTFVVGKTLDMFGANLPQNIVDFLKKYRVAGVYAECGKPVNYPQKSGYYDEIPENSQEFDNYFKFMEYTSKLSSSAISESLEVNERRVGLKSVEKIGGQTYKNIGAKDIKSETLKSMLNTILKGMKGDKPIIFEPMVIWGAPGIGKTTIPKDIVDAANDVVAESGGSNNDKFSIIVVDCSILQAGDLFMPMPVKITQDDIERVKNIPFVKEYMAAHNMTDKDCEKFITAHSSDVPKSWLPMWLPTGDKELDKARNAVANGHVSVIYDKEGYMEDTETHGGGGILMFDEFLRADPDTLFGIAQIMMTRQTTGGYRLGSKWYCMACSNRPTDDVRVKRSWSDAPPALKQRLKSYNFVPTFKDWSKWAKDKGGFDDFTIEFIGARGEDTPNSRWHNIDPDATEDDMETRSISPRQWSRAISELNKVCKIEGVKSYADLGYDTFLTYVAGFLPDDIAQEYVEEYIENGGSDSFRYTYDRIVNNPNLKVDTNVNAVAVTNHLKREIQSMFDASDKIPPKDLETIIHFLNDNFDTQSSSPVPDLIARICKYCNLLDNTDPNFNEYARIIGDYEQSHPNVDLDTLFDSIGNSMID